MLYDAVVVLGIWVFTVVLLVTLTGNVVVGWWVQSILFVELFVFFTFFWLNRGQTLGMQAWRLRIYRDDPIDLRCVFLRFLGALLGMACLFVGYFWILIDKQSRSWSDLLSNSQVVREPKLKRTVA